MINIDKKRLECLVKLAWAGADICGSKLGHSADSLEDIATAARNIVRHIDKTDEFGSARPIRNRFDAIACAAASCLENDK